MKRWLALGIFGGFVVAACGGDAETLPPTGQVVLFVSTDAPLPPPDGVLLRADEIPPLFDRLRIELFAPGEKTPCRDCTREFPLDRDQVKNGLVSFGFVPPPNVGGYVARLQLYRAIAVRQAAPIASAAVTRYIAMPKVAAEGIVTVGTTLYVDEIGQSKSTLEAPVLPDAGKPNFGLVGTWAGATRVKCKGAPQADEVCIPGGAYWMGDPTRGTETPQFEVATPRLVVLSPFFIDKTEVTVATFRAQNIARLSSDGKYAVDPYEAQNSATIAGFRNDVWAACTYTQTPGVKRASDHPRPPLDACGETKGTTSVPDASAKASDYDASVMNRNTDSLPVTCVSWAKATEYCRARGKDLPTAAQFEFLGGGFASHYYPWGDASPSCDDAVFLRAQSGIFVGCLAYGALGSPLTPGSGKLDRLVVEGGEVLDIAGNAQELVRDTWNRPEEPCWRPSLLHDPVCTAPTVDDAEEDQCGAHDASWGATPVGPHVPYTIKGGAWGFNAFDARAGRQDIIFPYAINVQTGFRCGRDDK